MDINKILRTAPAKVSEYCTKENLAYAVMTQKHEEYKRSRARKYLERRAKEATAIKDLDYALDCDEELCRIKDEELIAEIDYRAYRQKKETARDYFEAAMEQGRTKRAELRGLQDTIRR